jgi:low affinity Fe/Cu permease
MNTISSIVTFYFISHSECPKLQLKLDELIRVTEARNKFMGIERLSEPELWSATRLIRNRGDHRSGAGDLVLIQVTFHF